MSYIDHQDINVEIDLVVDIQIFLVIVLYTETLLDNQRMIIEYTTMLNVK